MKCTVSLLLVLAAATPALAKKKPVQNCKVTFQFVYVDRLDNVSERLPDKQQKEVERKLTNYGDVCYRGPIWIDGKEYIEEPIERTAPGVSVVLPHYIFFIHTKPAVYHGVHTTTDTSTRTDSTPVTGTVTDEDGNRSRISGDVDITTRTTTTSSVPYELDYQVFILDILVPHTKEGSTERTFTTLHTFDQKSLHNTMYGIGYGKGKKPIVNVIDAAAKWLHENNLGK